MGTFHFSFSNLRLCTVLFALFTVQYATTSSPFHTPSAADTLSVDTTSHVHHPSFSVVLCRIVYQPQAFQMRNLSDSNRNRNSAAPRLPPLLLLLSQRRLTSPSTTSSISSTVYSRSSRAPLLKIFQTQTSQIVRAVIHLPTARHLTSEDVAEALRKLVDKVGIHRTRRRPPMLLDPVRTNRKTPVETRTLWICWRISQPKRDCIAPHQRTSHCSTTSICTRQTRLPPMTAFYRLTIAYRNGSPLLC